jgi:hypothetical protein
MAVYKFSNAGGFATYTRYNDFLAGNTATPVITDDGSMFPIATFTLASTQATVEFTNIPQTYTHLQLRMLTRSSEVSSGQDSLAFRLNGDTGGSYAWHYLQGNGASGAVGAGSNFNCGILGAQTSSGYAAGMFSVFVADFLDYRNTSKFKTVRSIGGNDTNGTGTEPGHIRFSSSLWQNTNAITSIRIASGGDFARSLVTNSQFALYGVNA